MRRTVPLLALLLALALVLPHSVAAPGRPTPATATPGASHEREEKDEDDKDDDARGRGQGEGQRRNASSGRAPAAIGQFALSASQEVDGDFVDFSYNETTVTDFRVGGKLLLDLSVAGASDEDDHGARARGAEVRVATSAFRLVVHDNPEAVTKLGTEGVTTLRFAPGVTLEQVDDERIRFTLDNVTGVVRGDDARVAGQNVLLEGEMLLLLHAPRGGFDQHRERIGEAVAKRHVGAEGSFNHRQDDGGVAEDVVTYGNVTMRTIKAEKGNLTVEVEGHGFDGRVLVLNVDGRVVGASRLDDLTVLFDNETMRHADGIQDVLDPDDDGLHAEYYVVFDPETEAFQLLVSVPHYSVHTLSVTTILPIPPPSVVAGVLVGVLVLAATGVVLFRRPKA